MKTVALKPTARIDAPKSMTELRDRMNDLFAEAWNGERKREDVKEIANVAGKIIKSATAQIEYAAMRKEKHDIPFLT